MSYYVFSAFIGNVLIEYTPGGRGYSSTKADTQLATTNFVLYNIMQLICINLQFLNYVLSTWQIHPELCHDIEIVEV